MPIGMKPQKVYLDKSTCFHTYINCGSIGKTVKILHSQGVVNPKTGKPPTDMGVWNAVWLYALENMVEAKKLTFETWLNNGKIGTDLEWYTIILKRARKLLSKSGYQAFIEKHSYLKPYTENK